MISAPLLFVVILLIFIIVLLFETSLFIIDTKKFSRFLPFLFVGVVFCFHAVFVFYEIINLFLWSLFEYLSVVSVIWIVIVLRRKKW